MDVIGMLGSQLGLEETAAKAVAGAVMGAVKGQVSSELGEGEAKEIEAAVPELQEWEQAAAQVADAPAEEEEGGMFGGMLGAVTGGAGNDLLGAVAGKDAAATAALVGVLTKVGLDASKASVAGPILLMFLKSRLPEGTLEKVAAVAPMLTGTAPKETGGVGGAVAGALGGLLGN